MSSESFFLRKQKRRLRPPRARGPAGPAMREPASAAEARARGSGGPPHRAPALPGDFWSAGRRQRRWMEPATAPQPDMAPELTPEEEQVSRAADAVVVCPDPEAQPGCARGPGSAMASNPFPPAAAPQAVIPQARRRWPLLLLPALQFAAYGRVLPPPRIPMMIAVSPVGASLYPYQHPLTL